MDKSAFVRQLKASAALHYKRITAQGPLVSFGIYSDGDAGTIGFYYNTRQHLSGHMENAANEDSDPPAAYYVFCMEEWREDISYSLCDKKTEALNDQLYRFGTSSSEKGHEDYRDEIFDMFCKTLLELKEEGLFESEAPDFFLHMDVSDYWIDEKMLKRISALMSEERYKAYKAYADYYNAY